MKIDLRENEVVEKEVKGDYWSGFFGLLISQTRGAYAFTNERIVFRGGFATTKEIEYKEIESIKKCNVGSFVLRIIPTGILVKTKNGKKHYLSVLGRKDILSFLEGKVN